MNPLLLIVVLGAGAVALLVLGVSQMFGRRQTHLRERLETYTGTELSPEAQAAAALRQKILPRLIHVVLGRRYLENEQEALTRADIAHHPREYILTRLGVAAAGALIGQVGTGHVHSAVILGVAGFFVPAMFVRVHQNRRREKFITQLADALMLQTSSLRAGYGFLKGLELVAKEMDDPISKELNRTLREINLGATIEQALTNLGRRINSRDLDIVISAYLIQKDLGGNLGEIMEHVAETIRERLRIRGDIRTLTAQGRLSGILIGVLPAILCAYFFLRTPEYFAPMLGEPFILFAGGLQLPLGIVLLLLALVWQMIGVYFIYRIINVKI
jgi:tight adherence protein B